MVTRGIVLSSGGCDSTTCLGIAISELGADNVTTISALYGQRHRKELECANRIAKHYGVAHKVLDFTGTGILDGSNCPLLDNAEDTIKHESYASQIAKDGAGIVNTYVPFRNGLFLAAAAAVAMSVYPDDEVGIYIGAHADDAAGSAYADCSKDFTEAIGRAIEIGTYSRVHLMAPLVQMSKAEVVAQGLALGVPYDMTWSCYEGGSVQCGTCGTCIDRKAAFAANGVCDPVPYKE